MTETVTHYWIEVRNLLIDGTPDSAWRQVSTYKDFPHHDEARVRRDLKYFRDHEKKNRASPFCMGWMEYRLCRQQYEIIE